MYAVKCVVISKFNAMHNALAVFILPGAHSIYPDLLAGSTRWKRAVTPAAVSSQKIKCQHIS